MRNLNLKSNFHPSPRCRSAQSSQTSSLVSTPSAGTRCQSAPSLTSSYLTSAQTREPRELHPLTLPPGRPLVIINVVKSLSSSVLGWQAGVLASAEGVWMLQGWIENFSTAGLEHNSHLRVGWLSSPSCFQKPA